MKTNRCAFTVIELIAAISVILVLSALVVPVCSRALDKSRQAKCVSRLGQIGVALQSYASDNDGCLPWGYNPSDGGYWSSLLSRDEYLPHGLKANSALACPAEPKQPTSNSWVRSNYAANLIVMPERKNDASVRVRLVSVARPSQVVALMDSAVNRDGNSDWGIYSQPEITGFGAESHANRPIPAGPNGAAGTSNAVIRWRHPGGRANFLFLDGHVQAMAPGELLQKNVRPGY